MTKVLLILILVLTPGGFSAGEDDWIGQVVTFANKRCDRPPAQGLIELSPAHYEPKDLSEEQKIALVMRGLQHEKTADRRMACLKILVERFPQTTGRKLQSIATNGSIDVAIRKRAIWVAGFRRHESSIQWLESLLNDMNPSIREAAMDALGFCLFPYYTEKFQAPMFFDPLGVQISGRVPIFVNCSFRLGVVKTNFLVGLSEREAAKKLNQTSVPRGLPIRQVGNEKTRQRIAGRLAQVMVRGRTKLERIAAARALSGFRPPKYKLRVAEWGVWIESNGKLQLVQSVLDEIPPVAYQTTKQIAELKKRVNQIMVVTKPVIHLTVDRPMSITVSEFIRKGQPWYTYPQPTGFELDVFSQVNDREYSDADFLSIKKIVAEQGTKWKPFGKQAYLGYPFLLPKASKVGGFGGSFGQVNMIQAVGVRWQHLVVAPKQLDWMTEPLLSPEYNWWSELRKVDSAWISNGTESEKFLYYDGPTLLASPVQVSSIGKGSGHRLKVQYNATDEIANDKSVAANEIKKPHAVLIEVRKGMIRGHKLEFVKPDQSHVPSEEDEKSTKNVVVPSFEAHHSGAPSLNEKELKRVVREMLTTGNGLTDEEATGLIQAWENQFFETDGKRLIVRILKKDYDYRCPLKVTPEPTEISRVGLILSEIE